MASPDIQAGYLAVPGGRLYFEAAGAGQALLLLHAGIADHTMWDGAFERLAGRARVVRCDLRTYGRSLADNGAVFSFRDDLERLLDHLEIPRATVLGVSFGGRTALEFALERPRRVSGLVLVATGLHGLDHEPTALERELFARDEALGEAGDWEGMAALDVELWVDGPGRPAGRAHAWLRQQVKAMALGNYARFARRHPDPEREPRPVPLQPPALGRLAEVGVPTLIVVGTLDTSGTRAAAEVLAREIPNARMEVFESAAHLPNLEQPERFEELLSGFLEEVDRG